MAPSGQIVSRTGQHSRAVRNARTTAERTPRTVVVYAQNYADSFATEWHSHLRAQLLYAITGVMRVEADRAIFTIPPGTGLFVPAGVAHAVRMDGQTAMRALFLRADAARSGPAAVTVIAVSPLLRELILAACAEPLAWDLKGRGRHLAALMLDEIARARSLPLRLPAPRDPRLARVTERLRARPDDPRSLDEFAVEVGASVRTLARLFRQDIGMTFQQWRRQLRLTEASVRLAAGATPARAAAAVGYASAPAFGAAMRTVFGTTPGRIRSASSPPSE